MAKLIEKGASLIKITAADKKHAHQFWIIITRNAYGGNMMTAENALARCIAEERERCAVKLDLWDVVDPCALDEAAERLRSAYTSAAENRESGETRDEDSGRQLADVDQSDEPHDVSTH